MKTSDLFFNLPPELIAQEPKIKREEARLMVIDRTSGKIHHQHFQTLGLIYTLKIFWCSMIPE